MKNHFLLTINALMILGVFTLFSCKDDEDNSDPCDTTDLTLDVSASSSFRIVAEGLNGQSPYSYSIDGTTFQEAGEFEVSATEAEYTVTVKDNLGCTQTATVAQATLLAFTDKRDNQSYKAIKIGEQIWMGENLNVDTNTADSTSYYCYDDLPASCEAYGGLYSWHVARVACPENWHLPSVAEWETLIAELGGDEVAGGKMLVGGGSGFEGMLSGTLAIDEDDNFFLWEQE